MIRAGLVRLALALPATLGATLAAQAPTRAAGFVLRQSGGDAVPVPGVWVVLHHVGRATQGPLDSVQSAPDGRFGFRFTADSTANYLLSVRYRGVAYFSPPLATNPARPDTGLKLLVFDTSSVIRPRTRSRTLVVSRPDAIGSRTVIDWFVISNPLERTRVSRDSLDPSWSAVLPAEAVNAQVGDARINQFSPDAVGFRGDSVQLFAAVSPGDKELLVQYEIPAGHRRIELPVAGADSVDVFLEEPNADLDPAAGWTVTTQTFEGRGFRRFARAGAAAGRVAIRFPGLALQPGTVLPWLVGAFGLALALLSWRLLRRPETGPAGPSRIDGLVERLAALEARYRGREAELTPEQWEAYRRERAELVATLDAALVAARSRT